MQAAVGIAGQVNPHGHCLVGRGHPRGSPHVIVRTDRLHATDPSGNLDQCLGVRLDRVPTGIPRDAEVAGDRGRGGVVVPQRLDRQRHRPRLGFAHGAAKEWSSVPVARGQAGSRHRQIRLNHRTRTAAKHGASCSTWTRRPAPTATTPQSGARSPSGRTPHRAPARRLHGRADRSAARRSAWLSRGGTQSGDVGRAPIGVSSELATPACSSSLHSRHADIRPREMITITPVRCPRFEVGPPSLEVSASAGDHQAPLVGGYHELGSIAQAELCEDSAYVGFRSRMTDAEAIGQFCV